MSRTLEAALARVVQDLEEIEARWAVVGGLAVSARGEPRLTRDVDFAVATRDETEAERTVASLLERGHRVGEVLEHAPTGRLATVRLWVPGSSIVVSDLLFASCGIEDQVVEAATPLRLLPGRDVAVASLGHLVAMKLLSESDDRPRDREDLRGLVSAGGAADRRVARAACALISERGFARGRDLVGSLDAWWPSTA